MTLSKVALSIRTFRITIKIGAPSVTPLNVVILNAECNHAECCCAKCCGAKTIFQISASSKNFLAG
jgi:hypothetical protein